jgi:hypothetical protein
MKVGTISSKSTVIPEILGVATRVVEKVARKRNTISLSQLLFNHLGHLRNNPENLLLYVFVLPLRGEKNDLR